MKRKILILSGGTATAWHLCKTIKDCFANDFILCVGDVNPKNLIPASILCDEYYQLPYINDSCYYGYMIELLEEKEIDILVPLIDFDLVFFPNDNVDLLNLNVCSTAPNEKLMKICKSKRKVSELLIRHGILVPRIYDQSEIESNQDYCVKPDAGFGSKETGIIRGEKIVFSDTLIVQETLYQPEITVEVFRKDDYLAYTCRERIETKSGVCTKTRFYDYEEIGEIINRINTIIEFPLACCIQFMKNKDNKWCLTDLNMRLGAGTALSSAAGFCVSSAFLSVLTNKNNYKEYLKKVSDNVIVVRVYHELIMPG